MALEERSAADGFARSDVVLPIADEPHHLKGSVLDLGTTVEMLDRAAETPDQLLVPRPDWIELSGSEHFIQLYETDAFLLSSLRGFIGGRLLAGDAAIVVATAAHREALEEHLRADGLDVVALTASGQYVALDAADTLSSIMHDGLPEPERFAQIMGGIIARAAEGWRGVRIFGEMVALLWEEGNHSAVIRLEDLWNDLRRTHTFTLFCGYPMRSMGGEALAELLGSVCAAHSSVIPAESYAALAGPAERLRAIALLQQKAASLEAEIAQRKRTEEALRKSEDELNQSLRLRDEFLSAVSHDLRTPLTVLQGQAQVLQRQAKRGTLNEENLFRGLEQIESKSRSMTELIDGLLDVTRLRAGQELQLDHRMIDLVALAQDVVAEQQETTDHHHLVLQSTEPALIGRWDRLRLRRVVENLTGNAIKYSPEGGEIRLSLSHEWSPEGDIAVLGVQDQGIGIGRDDLPHIFERYYRGGNATNDGIKGTGIGLAGVQQIVKQHGGTIAVESQEGAGSTFTIRLPIDRVL